MKVDLTYLKNMSAGNKELVLEMIGIFKNQVIEFSEGLDDLYAKKDFENLGRLAHKAKSSISIMGLNELATELKSFETLARSGEQTEKYPEFITFFKEETQEALSELEEIVKNLELYI
ncbi:MAG: Hpt domain-containing protein [Bacteroidales bacterium]|nr:Hpt domain-containing protein [Bacteroidales bacterium]